VAEVVSSVDIEAPPEIVFAHLVTPEGLLAWLGQHAEIDAIPGGVFAVDIGGTPIRGEYVEVDPPSSVVITWGVLGNDVLPVGSSRVEFRLTPIASGTRLDLTHTGLPAVEQAKHAEGWGNLLPHLARVATA
jgi:uncharacterized protein YndB with AHSA1/START domain